MDKKKKLKLQFKMVDYVQIQDQVNLNILYLLLIKN